MLGVNMIGDDLTISNLEKSSIQPTFTNHPLKIFYFILFYFILSLFVFVLFV